jgi:hypothetical protein
MPGASGHSAEPLSRSKYGFSASAICAVSTDKVIVRILNHGLIKTESPHVA